MSSLVLVNAVGLTPRLLAHAPRLNALRQAGWLRPLREVVPAVTCTAQATLLTGAGVERHGIVANGWLFRDTAEVRFWQQSNALLQAEPLYVTARKRSPSFRCAACGQPLFESDTKFESGTGWPSFYRPIEGAIGTTVDRSFGMTRVDTDDGQGQEVELSPEPSRRRPCLHTDPHSACSFRTYKFGDHRRIGCDFRLA